MKSSTTIPYQILQKFGPNYLGSPSKSGEIRYKCPMCQEIKGTPDTKGKLYVNIHSLKFNCFRCGYKGIVSRNAEYDESKIYATTEQSMEVDEFIKDVSIILDGEDRFNLKIPITKVEESQGALNYLLGRGFTIEQCRYYDLRVGGLHSNFGRIVIPNEVDHLVYTDYFSARSYIGQTPKYLNPRKDKSKIVFNLHRIQSGTPVILVEGPLTAIAAGYHAVASLGKTLSDEQAAKIVAKHPTAIYVNYDYGAETFADQACLKFSKLVSGEIPIYNVLMKDERDAADLTKDEYLQCLKEAKLYNPVLSNLSRLLN